MPVSPKTREISRIKCLNFIHDVTLVIVSKVETEYNIRRSEKLRHKFTAVEKNMTRQNIARQETIELFRQVVMKQGKSYIRMVVLERILGHRCACIYNKLIVLISNIIEHHHVNVFGGYTADIDTTRENVYDSVLSMYKAIYAEDESLTESISSLFAPPTEDRQCNKHRTLKEIVFEYNKLKRKREADY